MNEEEIKVKLLLPFLNDLGFEISEIGFEESFTIRIGKSLHNVTQNSIKGRLDILCRRNGKNLFIIEVKNDSISITQNDIEQGISYARALDQIAPFTIITNVKTTRIFDSVSKKELTGKNISEESDFWKNNYTLSTDEELKIRYEALTNFVSFSSDNLKIFCESQVESRMKPIIGNINSPSAKFIKELYCQRQNLQTTFNNFIVSDAKIFSIIGVAGVGKTNAICSLALQNLNDKFVFFYNATITNKSPLEHIAQDLNGVFSTKSESDLILKKLDELAKSLNKNVIIFVDGIDESRNPNMAIELSEIALACRNLSMVKFCISCKSNIWENMLKVNGTPTHLYEEVNKFKYNNTSNNGVGYLLEDFNDEELERVIPLYKNAFGFKGQISKFLLKELRNGFFLRIFSEVYSHKQIPDKIEDKQLIQKYIRQSLETTNLGFQSGLRILSKIGEIIMSQNYSSLDASKDEGLEINNLLEKLDFALDENLPEDLFSRNILIKSNKEDYSYNIAFYYSKIRDYIICFHTYKLDQLSDNEFYNLLEIFYENYIGQSAIDFYIENATVSHKQTFINFKKDKALQFVVSYDSYIDENFKNFKKKFDPKTNGVIGIILSNDLENDNSYALFPLDTRSSNRLKQIGFGHPFSGFDEDSKLMKMGVNTIYGSYKPFLISDQKKVVKQNIFKQLKEILKKGKLTTYNSEPLLLEQLSTIFYYYNKKLNYDFKIKDYYLPRYDQIYPINLNELRERLYKFLAYHYYRRDPYLENIDLRVEESFLNNVEIPALNILGDFPPFDELFKIVNILLEKGYTEVQNHHLPLPDKSIAEAENFYKENRSQYLNRVRIFQYSEGQAKLYIKNFINVLELSYQKFVEYNFPTLKNEFSFYSNCPHDYFFYMKDLEVLKWGYFGYRHSKSGNINIYFSDKSQDQAFKDDGISSLRGFSLDSFLHNDYHDRFKTFDSLNTPKVDEFCVIRNWIYKLLEKDMEKLFKENKY